MRIIDLSREFSFEQYARNPHSGTHIDSPAYVLDNGKEIGAFSPQRFMPEAVLLDLSRKRPGEPIDDEDLEAAEEAAGLALREQEAAILHTSSLVTSPGVYLSRNGAEYLEFKGVGLVGIDAVSIDNSESSEMTAHRVLLGKQILVLEGLCNLELIDSSRFRLVSLPLWLSAATSPVRAVAILE
jgi:kynurenine formamidase